MSTPVPPAQRRGGVARRAATVWAVVAALAGGLTLALWATGGLATDSTPYLGERLAPGEFVSTRFWDVAVHGAEVSHAKGEILVAVTIVNKQRESAMVLTDYMLGVRLPDGTAMLQTFCLSERGLRFPPMIPADALCEFRYEANDVPPSSIPSPGPVDIEVVILDQQLSDGLILSARPEISETAAWIPLRASVAIEDE